MKKVFVALLLVLWPAVCLAVTTIVPEGTVVSGGDVHSIVTQEVYGEADNFTVSGVQKVMQGGITRGSILFNQQDVLAGGKSYNTYVHSSAVQNVSGEAYGSTVVTRGSISVKNGGYISGAVVNGGSLIVASGSRAEGTVLNSGLEVVSGTDGKSRVSGGIQRIRSGGVSSGAQIDGGQQEVDAGGRTEQAVVSGDGRMQVSGSSVEATVASGGVLDVLDYGRAEGTLIAGGDMYISKNAVSENTTMTSGRQDVYGTENGAKVNGGVQNVWSGATVENTLVDTRGVQRVYAGGTAVNTQVSGAGLLALYSGGTLQGKTVLKDSILSIVGDNHIQELELGNSLVSIPRLSEGFTSLQIDELNGDGLFDISSNLAENQADTINVGSGSGNFGLILHDYSAEGSPPQRFKIIDEDAGAADNFYLVGDAVDVGAFQYSLQQDGNDWVLVKTQETTDSSVIAKNTYTSLASLFYTHLNPLYNRLRLKRTPAEKDNGLWFKGVGRRIKFDYDDGSGSSMDVYGVEGGYDREILERNGNRILLGVYSGYTDARQIYDRSGHGDADTRSVGVYSSLRTPDRWFADIIGTYFRHDQKVKSYTPSGSGVEGKYSADAWQASLFAGRRFVFEGGWFAEPSAGISYMHIGGLDYRTNFNTPVVASAADYSSISLEIAAGRSWLFDDAALADVYGKFGIIYDWDGTASVRVADYIFTEDLTSVRYEAGGGFSISLNEDSLAYAEASTQFGDKVRFPWEITFGLQLLF